MRTFNWLSRIHVCAIVALVSLSVTTMAQASDTTTSFFWQIQDTGFSGNEDTVVALRNGEAWPVIFKDNGDVYSLFATEGPNSGSNWHQIGTGLYSTPNRMRAATSPDGRVAILSSSPNPDCGVISTLPSGWASLPADTKAITFDSAGNLITADQTSVSSIAAAPPVSTPIIDIALSVNGDVGILEGNLSFHEYSPLLGVWQTQDLTQPQNGSFEVSSGSASLAYDSLGRPHVVGINTNDSTVRTAGYDIQSGHWTTSVINQSLPGPGTDSKFLELDVNDQGVLGTAFIQDGDLYYAYKDVSAAWATDLVASSVDGVDLVGIAFDYEDLPIISYSKNSRTYLAYDPIVVVPEPASVMMLLGMTALAFRRTRSS
jgi:hypothetical protein